MDMREQNTTAFAPLPWPHTADKAILRIVAAGSGNPARSASLARFLAAAFLFLALLLLLIGLAKQHEAALAGAGGLLLAGLSLLAIGRFNVRPVVLLNREKKEILLSRRRLGRLQFHAVPVDRIELSVEQHASFCRLHIVPRHENGANEGRGRSTQDKQWRSGMTLACRANGEHLPALLRDWLDYGLALDVDDSGDAEEYAAALDGMRLPPEVEAWARPGSPGKWSSENTEAEGTANRPASRSGSGPALNSEPHEAPARRPEIHRAGDLRDATLGRDKRG